MPTNDGPSALRAYLKATGQSATAFARKHDIDRVHLHRILSGLRGKRVTVDFAYVIERATGRRVRWDVWVSRDARVAA
jgi:hypothetical protein